MAAARSRVCGSSLIVGGALYYNFNIEELDANPSMISKLNTLMQILLVLLVVTDAGPYPMPGMAMSLLVWATLATTVASGSRALPLTPCCLPAILRAV